MLDPLTVITLLAPILLAVALYRLVTHHTLPHLDRRTAVARGGRSTVPVSAPPARETETLGPRRAA